MRLLPRVATLTTTRMTAAAVPRRPPGQIRPRPIWMLTTEAATHSAMPTPQEEVGSHGTSYAVGVCPHIATWSSITHTQARATHHTGWAVTTTSQAGRHQSPVGHDQRGAGGSPAAARSSAAY